MAIHDSEVSWNEFRDQVLLPRLQAGVAGGFATPPQESTMEIYKLLRVVSRSSSGAHNRN